MQVTAITKFKLAKLHSALQRLEWTQADLARKSGISQQTIGRILNLLARPTEHQATQIQVVLAQHGEYLDVLAEWPESFSGLRKPFRIEQTQEVQLENILDCPEALQIPLPEADFQTGETDDELERQLSALSLQEQAVLRERFWNSRTLKQTGFRLGRISRERVRQVEAKALRKLRSRMIKEEDK